MLVVYVTVVYMEGVPLYAPMGHMGYVLGCTKTFEGVQNLPVFWYR